MTEQVGQRVPTARAGSEPMVRANVAAFARVWASTVMGSSYVPMTRAEVRQHLEALTEVLVDTLRATPFRTEPGYEIGTRLVEAHFTGTDTLGRTVQLLGDDLLSILGLPEDEVTRSRLAALQGAVSAGYARALRERTLAEQEAIRAAVLDARDGAEARLRASEARFRAMFTEAAIGIGMADLGGRILDVNQAFQEILGFTAEEMKSRNVRELMHPEDAASVWRLYEQLVRGECDHYRSEKRFYTRSGEQVWTNLTLSLVRDEHGEPQYQVAMVEDVTDRHLLQNRLRYQALHDPLTELPNRALFLERLNRAFSSKEKHTRLGLCYLDLDGFKMINDSLGHETGDLLLVEVGRRLKESVDGNGRMVARMGGDEFVILVEDTTGTEDVITVADRVPVSYTVYKRQTTNCPSRPASASWSGPWSAPPPPT